MNWWWNKPHSDSRWELFWARFFFFLYLFAVIITTLQPSWHLVSAGLLGYGIGWYLTMARYSQKSQSKFLYYGGWWSSLDEVKKNSDLWNVSARHIFVATEGAPRLYYAVKYFIRTNLGQETLEGTVSGYCRKDCEEKAQGRLERFCEAMKDGEHLLEAKFQLLD